MKRHEAIEDAAVEWLIRRDETLWSAADALSLEAWLDESMAHKAAFWRAEQGWRGVDRVRSLGNQGSAERPSKFSRPARTWHLIAASLVVAFGTGLLWLSMTTFDAAASKPERFATAVGARKTVPLADGSKVELNTATVVRASVGEQAREIWLDAGEAYFEVRHIDGRPFKVHAGRQTVTVLGTKFSVRRDADRVVVNVREGRVRVDDGDVASARAIIIDAGSFAIARDRSTLLSEKSQQRVEDALAWRGGMLSFDQVPLSEVAAEFNRYNKRPIIILDPDAGAISIGGTFQASNVEAFGRLLRDAYGLKVEVDANAVKISS